MTRDEIEIVAKIMLTADNWCGTCNMRLLEQLSEAFPEHADAINALDVRGLERAWHKARDLAYDPDTPDDYEMPPVWRLEPIDSLPTVKRERGHLF